MPQHHNPDIGKNLTNKGGAAQGANSENYLPENIRCFVCKKDKPNTNYSNRQLLAFKPTVFSPNPKQKSIKATCKTCTPGQTTELRCCICNHDKGLDRFSKNQRKNPDTARCIACVEKHLDTEPDVTPPSSDSYSSEDDDSSGSDFDAPAWEKPEREKTSFHTKQHKSHSTSFLNSAASDTSRANTAHANATHSDDEDDEWVPVDAAGGRNNSTIKPIPLRTGVSASSVLSSDSHFAPAPYRGRGPAPARGPPVRSAPVSLAPPPQRGNKWAKPEKIAKCKDSKRGERSDDENSVADSEDEWVAYGRELREKKEGKKLGTTKVKRTRYESSEDE